MRKCLLVVALCLMSNSADACIFQRLRQRLQGQHHQVQACRQPTYSQPSCPGGVCPAPARIYVPVPAGDESPPAATGPPPAATPTDAQAPGPTSNSSRSSPSSKSSPSTKSLRGLTPPGPPQQVQ